MKWTLLTSPVEHEDDIVTVRQRVRSLAERLGFEVQDQTRIATAVSEIARNAYGYAGGGRVEYGLEQEGGGQSLVIRISDKGPGIAELDAILEGRYRSTTGLGIGITGSRRLMDHFEIETAVGQGTVVTFGKRLPSGVETFTGPRLAKLAEAVARSRTEDPLVALRDQNRELMRSLAELAERQDEAERLNRELAETNRGVVALHAELEDQAAQLREAGASLESQVAARTAELAEANARLLAEAVERERTEEALRQAQKLEAVGQLTGGVAHDFNNLLTVIKSSTDLLKRPDLAPERRERYVAAISDTVDRAAKLTGQLLAFARRQSLKPEVFAACDSVRALSDMMGTLTGSCIRIVTDLPEGTCFVHADQSQFDTALVNMAVNARDAMEGEGQLTIRVLGVEGMPPIRGQAAVEGPYVAVSISDTGVGIPGDRLERIFEPFFTTKGVGQGTGLGLSQVFGFAKQSGGEVTVASGLGHGATFTMYLPRVPEVERETDNEPEPLVDGHGTCVLVVEDNAEVGTFAVQTLTDLGYVPVLANNAEEALAELARDADRFDVVFSDVVMPGMNGLDLARRIREEHHDLPVLLASGYSHVMAQNGTYGFELLHKPYSVEQLSRLLRKVATWQRRKRIISL
ncbi:ATP-binding protein [Methylorubrum extorquens]|uniref:histidine kinase n=1 Tax=Methylorubrum extorquens (strain CM4 / NCIMB 13688) TaxID=440085 RepID=B7KTW5_METC4|nr:ATP-binding protein [Methylorubrum extorquens]ACK84175.1 histidine kinase [Methylorubrum extorquens CM4]